MIRNFLIKYKRIIVLFFASKIILIALLVSTYPLLPFSLYDYQVNGYQFFQNPGLLEKNIAAYDGQWYLHIATHGYRNFSDPNLEAASYAFFPLYPLLTKLVSIITGGNMALGALFITFVCSFGSTILLYKLIRLEYSELLARYTTIYFLVTPSIIFFTATYTEALFFMLTAGAWYLVRTNRWWWSAPLAYLAALTRPQGVFLFIPFVVEYVFSVGKSAEPLKKKILKGVSLLGAPLGLLTYYTFLYFETGNFFTHLITNQERWGRKVPDFFQIVQFVIDRVLHVASFPFHDFHYSQLDTIFLASALALIIPMAIRLRPSYTIWALILVTLPLITGTTTSMTRYISLSFPHYLFLALIGVRYRVFHFVICIISSGLGLVLAIRFVHWYWAG